MQLYFFLNGKGKCDTTGTQVLETILYHGTASEIQQVDVKLGRERKDSTDDDIAFCLKAY